MRSRQTWSRAGLVGLVALFVVLGARATGAEPAPPGVAAPAASVEAPPAPAPPEAGSDLFIPKPEFKCLTGWCSSNAQCVEWEGPGSVCIRKPGVACGHCA